jgi:hypothetical protein
VKGEFTKTENCAYDEGFLGVDYANQQSSSIGNVPRNPPTISGAHQHFRTHSEKISFLSFLENTLTRWFTSGGRGYHNESKVEADDRQ